MGKKSKSAKSAKIAAGENGDSLPSFDENALSALTAKIEQGLGNGEPQKAADAPNTKQKKGKASASTAAEPKKAKAQEAARGTKRDAHGKPKTNGKANGQKETSSSKNGDKSDEREALLQEILALGGTEEDLDLVADALSDEEENTAQDGPADKSLKIELAKFVAGLGIEGQSGGDIEESEEEEVEEAAEDSWEEASDLEPEVSEEAVESKPVKEKPATALNPDSEDPNLLVSPLTY
jgi:ribosome biogenesis protein MAK21